MVKLLLAGVMLLITNPIFQKVIAHFTIDPVQFGLVLTLASMIGLLTPPVGMCLYAVSSIIGDVTGHRQTAFATALFLPLARNVLF